MTVAELIEKLKTMPGDYVVVDGYQGRPIDEPIIVHRDGEVVI